MEKDISNSKRHAVFPWQLGFHRNLPAKDAIRLKNAPTYTRLYCMHTNVEASSRVGTASVALREEDARVRLSSGSETRLRSLIIELNYRPLMLVAQL